MIFAKRPRLEKDKCDGGGKGRDGSPVWTPELLVSGIFIIGFGTGRRGRRSFLVVATMLVGLVLMANRKSVPNATETKHSTTNLILDRTVMLATEGLGSGSEDEGGSESEDGETHR